MATMAKPNQRSSHCPMIPADAISAPSIVTAIPSSDHCGPAPSEIATPAPASNAPSAIAVMSVGSSSMTAGDGKNAERHQNVDRQQAGAGLGKGLQLLRLCLGELAFGDELCEVENDFHEPVPGSNSAILSAALRPCPVMTATVVLAGADRAVRQQPAQRRADRRRGRLDIKPEPTKTHQRRRDLALRDGDDAAAVSGAAPTAPRRCVPALPSRCRRRWSVAVNGTKPRIAVPRGRESGTVRRLHREKPRHTRDLAAPHQIRRSHARGPGCCCRSRSAPDVVGHGESRAAPTTRKPRSWCPR